MAKNLTSQELLDMQQRIERSRYVPLAPKKAEPAKKKGRKPHKEVQIDILRDKSQPTEAQEHKALVVWLKYTYPNMLFNTDMSGIKLSMGQAIKCASLRSNRAMPDLHIFEPKGMFHGLFIELKRSGEKLWNKEGNYRTPHLEEQFKVLTALEDRGYKAKFAIGAEEAKKIVTDYMNL